MEEEDSLIEPIDSRRTDPYFGMPEESRHKKTTEEDIVIEVQPRKKVHNMAKRVRVVNGNIIEVNEKGRNHTMQPK